MTKSILILNGPNLNTLGQREPEIYGSQTLADIEVMCREEAKRLGLEIDFRQSNSEGELVDWIQEATKSADGVILNAGAYSHTSIAILDALKILNAPIIEVHVSNPFQREDFRHYSFVSQVAKGVICGLGAHGYILALSALHELLAA